MFVWDMCMQTVMCQHVKPDENLLSADLHALGYHAAVLQSGKVLRRCDAKWAPHCCYFCPDDWRCRAACWWREAVAMRLD